MRKRLLLCMLGCLACATLWAQSLVVGANTADPAAIMDLKSTSKGLLIPRLTKTNINDITAGLGATQEGLLVYNTTTQEFNYWDGTEWVVLHVGKHWSITGDAGTVDGTNFIGTTDNIPFNIKVFNEKAGRISSAGQTFYGYQAGNSNNTGRNTGIGFRALFSNTTGYSNVAIGIRALNTNTTGYQNIAIGDSALFSNTAFENIGIGTAPLYSNISGYRNIAMGYNTLFANIDGLNNIAFGYYALFDNLGGNNNIAKGYRALSSNTTGTQNIANGHLSLYLNTIGKDNIANGYRSLNSNTSGNNNVSNGLEALYENTIGDNNIAYGSKSLSENSIGVNNIGFGRQTLSSSISGNNNLAFGSGSLSRNTNGVNNIAFASSCALCYNETGDNNIAYGFFSLLRNISGLNNIAMGYEAIYDNISGEYNIAFGYNSQKENTTGNNNVGMGFKSLFNNTSSNNIAIGAGALEFSVSGVNNTAIGNVSLHTIDFGSQNTGIGSYTNPNFNNVDNTTSIGFNAITNASNRIRIGNTLVTTIVGQVAYTTSDGRFKTNVENKVPGLDFIVGLRPVTYHFEKLKFSQFIGENQDENYVQKLKNQDAENKTSTGFIAQEVEALAQKFNYDFDGVLAPQNEKDSYHLGYQQFVVPLMKAVQELNEKNRSLESQLVVPQTVNRTLYAENDLQIKQIANLLAEDEAQQLFLLELQNEIQQLKNKNK